MSRATKTLSVLLLGLCCQAGVYAEEAPEHDTLSFKLSKALSPNRFFMRAGAIAVKIKTKSGDTYDVTGPVATKAELQALIDDGGVAIRESILVRDPVAGAVRDGTRPGSPTVATSIANALAGTGTVSIARVIEQMDAAGLTELGTPPGITAVAEKNASTGGLSLGYYLGDDHSWIVEAYVLAKPIETSVAARGPTTYIDTAIHPFSLQGQTIVSTNLLPPTVMFGKYWGGRDDKVRLFTGAMGMYAIFYGTKATEALNSFVGGSSPGSTTVSLKNTFGAGPMLGAQVKLNDDWHVSLNVGSVKLKTQGTLTTRNTFITKATGATQEYGRPLDQGAGDSVTATLNTAEEFFDPDTGSIPSSTRARSLAASLGGATGVAMGAIAYNRGQCTSASNCTLGDYVRKTDVSLQNTIFMLSVGRTF